MASFMCKKRVGRLTGGLLETFQVLEGHVVFTWTWRVFGFLVGYEGPLFGQCRLGRWGVGGDLCFLFVLTLFYLANYGSTLIPGPVGLAYGVGAFSTPVSYVDHSATSTSGLCVNRRSNYVVRGIGGGYRACSVGDGQHVCSVLRCDRSSLFIKAESTNLGLLTGSSQRARACCVGGGEVGCSMCDVTLSSSGRYLCIKADGKLFELGLGSNSASRRLAPVRLKGYDGGYKIGGIIVGRGGLCITDRRKLFIIHGLRGSFGQPIVSSLIAGIDICGSAMCTLLRGSIFGVSPSKGGALMHGKQYCLCTRKPSGSR